MIARAPCTQSSSWPGQCWILSHYTFDQMFQHLELFQKSIWGERNSLKHIKCGRCDKSSQQTINRYLWSMITAVICLPATGRSLITLSITVNVNVVGYINILLFKGKIMLECICCIYLRREHLKSWGSGSLSLCRSESFYYTALYWQNPTSAENHNVKFWQFLM